jgi:hypothetical protein
LTVEHDQEAGSLDNQTLWSNHRVIPLINVKEKEALWKFWHDIPFDTIAISYFTLKGKPSLYQEALKSGIKSALDFKGTVISILVGDNYALERTTVEGYCQDLEMMGFDVATTHDDYLYYDDPENCRWSRLHTMLEKACKLVRLDPDFEVVGIVKGSTDAEFEFCATTLDDLGIDKVAFPCSELLQQRRLTDVSNFLRIGKEFGLWRWLVGINSLRYMRRLGADAYSGHGWCYGAASNLAYDRDRMVKVTLRLDCTHETCLCAQRLGRPLPIVCARHSISQLVGLDHELKKSEIDGYRIW